MIELYGDPNSFDQANDILISAFIDYFEGGYNKSTDEESRMELINTIRRYDNMRRRKLKNLFMDNHDLFGDEPI